MANVRLGVLGGTFDPIHFGHLRLADEAIEAFELDHVLFIPAGIPPHKQVQTVTDAADRLMITWLATAPDSRFRVSPIELHRTGPSYTVDTLCDLHRDHGPGAEIYFILGVDAVLEMPSWRDPERVLSLCHPAVAYRPGFDADMLRRVPLPSLMERIKLFAGPHIDLSSTQIRERIALRRSIRYMTPDAVCSYIHTRGLYRAKRSGGQAP